jgi:hypothetical protein
MPLSDEERKVLEELELDLAADDPRLARELSSGFVKNRFKASRYFAAIACLIGVVLLIAGVASQIIVVGVGGFLLMGTGTYFLVEGTRLISFSSLESTLLVIRDLVIRDAEERRGSR